MIVLSGVKTTDFFDTSPLSPRGKLDLDVDYI